MSDSESEDSIDIHQGVQKSVKDIGALLNEMDELAEKPKLDLSYLSLTGQPAPYAENKLDEQGLKTGVWAEYFDDEETLKNRFDELQEVKDVIGDCEHGEGFGNNGFSYIYEKGMYQAGKRVGKWMKIDVKRIVEEIFHYTDDGEKTGQYITFECDCHDGPRLGSVGNYASGVKSGPEYSGIKYEDGVSTNAWDTINPLRKNKNKKKELPSVMIGQNKYLADYVTNYDNTGKIVSQGSVDDVKPFKPEFVGEKVDGKKNGYWEDNTGKGEYILGVKHGKWMCHAIGMDETIPTRFYANDEESMCGRSNKDDFATFDHGVLSGPYSQEYGKGEYLNNKRVGVWTDVGWSKDTITYVDGVRNGPGTDKKMKGDYLNGKKEGAWTDGTCILTYRNDVLNGPSKNFDHSYSNKISSEGEYLNGKATGEWKYYDDTGKLKETGQYEAGIRIGKWSYYLDRSDVVMSGEFKDGTPVGQWSFNNVPYTFTCRPEVNFHSEYLQTNFLNYALLCYERVGLKVIKSADTLDKKKDLIDKGLVKCDLDEKGEYHGKYSEYSDRDILQVSGAFEHGVPIGQWTYYSMSGAVESTGSFSNTGKQHGMWQYFERSRSKDTMEISGEYRNGVRIGVWNCAKFGIDFDYGGN